MLSLMSTFGLRWHLRKQPHGNQRDPSPQGCSKVWPLFTLFTNIYFLSIDHYLGDEEAKYWKKIQDAREKREESKKKKEQVVKSKPSTKKLVVVPAPAVEKEVVHSGRDLTATKDIEAVELSQRHSEAGNSTMFEAPKRKQKTKKASKPAAHVRFSDSENDGEEDSNEEPAAQEKSDSINTAAGETAPKKNKKKKKKKAKQPQVQQGGPGTVISESEGEDEEMSKEKNSKSLKRKHPGTEEETSKSRSN